MAAHKAAKRVKVSVFPVHSSNWAYTLIGGDEDVVAEGDTYPSVCGDYLWSRQSAIRAARERAAQMGLDTRE